MEPDDTVLDFQVKEGGKPRPPPSVDQVQVSLQILGMKLPPSDLVEDADRIIRDFLKR